MSAAINKFAWALRSERERRKMTLEEMAQFLGTTKQALSRYERGERNPKLITAALFAKKLEIPIAYFEGDVDFDSAAIPHIEESDEENKQQRIIETLVKYKEIIDLFDSLPKELQNQAKDYLRFLATK